ncbi:MAG: DNA primase, partial [Oleibacter sp.]|nr:DNA primase [Thalassolituus sp.]
MAGRIPQSFIDDLLARVDVVDVVDSRVKLKKTGKNYSACCPFHNEKSPSFTVSPDKQFYYCFGCGASGTALKFVMEFDGLSFPDAVEKLATQTGMEVPREQASFEVRQEQQHQPLFDLMQKAGRYYEQMLRAHEKKARAVDYLKNRGLSGKAAKFFGIGYAPPGWDNLQNFLAENGDKETIKQLVTCGMLIEKEDSADNYRTYDRFRDRIMFPIRDARGRYIAFGGRVLGDEKPKYLNSPETPIFHKGRELYGLYEARKIRQKLTRMVIVEGYMDVVALAEFGIHYAVAT